MAGVGGAYEENTVCGCCVCCENGTACGVLAAGTKLKPAVVGFSGVAAGNEKTMA